MIKEIEYKGYYILSNDKGIAYIFDNNICLGTCYTDDGVCGKLDNQISKAKSIINNICASAASFTDEEVMDMITKAFIKGIEWGSAHKLIPSTDEESAKQAGIDCSKIYKDCLISKL